jgi:hypothetical protein
MKELDVVTLLDDLPEHGLKKGDRGTIVHEYRGHSAYEVEFIAPSGKTIAIVTLTTAKVRLAESVTIRSAGASADTPHKR